MIKLTLLHKYRIMMIIGKLISILSLNKLNLWKIFDLKIYPLLLYQIRLKINKSFNILNAKISIYLLLLIKALKFKIEMGESLIGQEGNKLLSLLPIELVLMKAKS